MARIALYALWCNYKMPPHHFVDAVGQLGHRVEVYTSAGFRSRCPSPGPGNRVFISRQLCTLPFSRLRPVRKYNQWQLDRSLAKFAGAEVDLHVFGDVAVYEPPFKPPRFVYYCLDDWAGFPGHRDQIGDHEQKLCRMADRIWVVSRHLVKKFEQAFGEKLEYVPNGVNVEHYRHVPELKKNRPHPRPVLTYMGGMGVWFDHELVAAVAEELRDWDILLIGPTYFGEAEKQRLALPNIQFTGLLPYESLPEILAGSDVGMIPFGISQLVNGFSPLKLYEYLAAGLPVVATPMPEVLPFVEPGVVACTDDPRRFAQAARELLAGAQSRRCQQVAEQHSWRSRFAKALANIL